MSKRPKTPTPTIPSTAAPEAHEDKRLHRRTAPDPTRPWEQGQPASTTVKDVPPKDAPP